MAWLKTTSHERGNNPSTGDVCAVAALPVGQAERDGHVQTLGSQHRCLGFGPEHTVPCCRIQPDAYRRVRSFFLAPLPLVGVVLPAACDLALLLPPAAIRPRSLLRSLLVISRVSPSHCNHGYWGQSQEASGGSDNTGSPSTVTCAAEPAEPVDTPAAICWSGPTSPQETLRYTGRRCDMHRRGPSCWSHPGSRAGTAARGAKGD